MSVRPFFSICIAAYNADRYINRCLLSIAVQSFSSYEVIVVDDGSASPLHIAPECRDKIHSLRLIRQSNSGPYLARQHAFDLAKGRYLLAFDSDDELVDTEALSKLHALLRSGADIAIFNAATDTNPQLPLLNFEYFPHQGRISFEDIFSLLLSSYSLNSLWCKAFSREVYLASKESLPRPRLVYAEDRLQSFELVAAAKSFVFLEDILYIYRVNPESTTNSKFKPDYLEQQLFVESEIVAYAKRRGISLEKWSSVFLKSVLTNIKLLGFNTGLSYSDKKHAYQTVTDNVIYKEALRRSNLSFLNPGEKLITFFLSHRLYDSLCLYSLAIAFASSAKREAYNHLIRSKCFSSLVNSGN